MPRISSFNTELDLVNYALSSMGQRKIDAIALNGERVNDLIVNSLSLVKNAMFCKYNRPYSFANTECPCILVDDLGDEGSIWRVDDDYYCITDIRRNPTHFGNCKTPIKWHINDAGNIVTDFRIATAPAGVDAGDLLLADANVDVAIGLWPVSAITAYVTILQKYLTYALSGQAEDSRLVLNEIDSAMTDMWLNDKTASSFHWKLFDI